MLTLGKRAKYAVLHFSPYKLVIELQLYGGGKEHYMYGDEGYTVMSLDTGKTLSWEQDEELREAISIIWHEKKWPGEEEEKQFTVDLLSGRIV